MALLKSPKQTHTLAYRNNKKEKTVEKIKELVSLTSSLISFIYLPDCYREFVLQTKIANKNCPCKVRERRPQPKNRDKPELWLVPRAVFIREQDWEIPNSVLAKGFIYTSSFTGSKCFTKNECIKTIYRNNTSIMMISK